MFFCFGRKNNLEALRAAETSVSCFFLQVSFSLGALVSIISYYLCFDLLNFLLLL